MTAIAIDTAARTAWGEARGEGEIGMRAVLNVIGNRAARPGWWGHDIASVCRSPWQFSCWNADDQNLPELIHVLPSDPEFRIALGLAKYLVAGALDDVTDRSDSYFAVGSEPPEWAKPQFFKTKIGRHAFYRVGLDGDGR